MADYQTYPKPSPDKDAGRSATPTSKARSGGGQHNARGAMGKTKTGDGTEGTGK